MFYQLNGRVFFYNGTEDDFIREIQEMVHQELNNFYSCDNSHENTFDFYSSSNLQAQLEYINQNKQQYLQEQLEEISQILHSKYERNRQTASPKTTQNVSKETPTCFDLVRFDDEGLEIRLNRSRDNGTKVHLDLFGLDFSSMPDSAEIRDSKETERCTEGLLINFSDVDQNMQYKTTNGKTSYFDKRELAMLSDIFTHMQDDSQARNKRLRLSDKTTGTLLTNHTAKLKEISTFLYYVHEEVFEKEECYEIYSIGDISFNTCDEETSALEYFLQEEYFVSETTDNRLERTVKIEDISVLCNVKSVYVDHMVTSNLAKSQSVSERMKFEQTRVTLFDKKSFADRQAFLKVQVPVDSQPKSSWNKKDAIAPTKHPPTTIFRTKGKCTMGKRIFRPQNFFR